MVLTNAMKIDLMSVIRVYNIGIMAGMSDGALDELARLVSTMEGAGVVLDDRDRLVVGN